MVLYFAFWNCWPAGNTKNGHISSQTIINSLKTCYFDRSLRDLFSNIKIFFKIQVVEEIFIEKDDFFQKWQSEK